MFNNILNILKNHIINFFGKKTLSEIQVQLINAEIMLKAEDFVSIIILSMLFIFLSSLTVLFISGINLIFSILFTSALPLIIFIYIYYKNEKRLENIEMDLPDYIRQISSLIKVGYGIESAFNELSKTVHNSLNDEIKRALLETSFGKPFGEALMDIATRNNSENLKHTFQIIIHSNETGGNISDILDVMSNDLNENLMLKKERKASVMMSVMFLLISSCIATPFALGMIRLYSEYLGQMGRSNPLESVIPMASMGYVFIQAILVSLLIGIVLHSNVKKGFKFTLIIVPFSIIVYFFSQYIFKGVLGV